MTLPNLASLPKTVTLTNGNTNVDSYGASGQYDTYLKQAGPAFSRTAKSTSSRMFTIFTIPRPTSTTKLTIPSTAAAMSTSRIDAASSTSGGVSWLTLSRSSSFVRNNGSAIADRLEYFSSSCKKKKKIELADCHLD